MARGGGGGDNSRKAIISVKGGRLFEGGDKSRNCYYSRKYGISLGPVQPKFAASLLTNRFVALCPFTFVGIWKGIKTGNSHCFWYKIIGKGCESYGRNYSRKTICSGILL